MGIHAQIDDWLLGRGRSINPKRGGGSGISFKQGTGFKNLQAASLKKPEVMVKIPKRTGNSTGKTGIKNHLDYIGRNGQVAIEDKDGFIHQSKGQAREIAQRWHDAGYLSSSGKKREALNIVLSMPPGTPPESVRDAAREFAKTAFSDHEYVFALHTDEPHPHVHLMVSMQNELGQRMNPRKNDLYHWRVLFAEKMREQGVDCAATRRQHRGQTQKADNGIIRNIQKRGKVPEVQKQHIQEFMQALKDNKRPLHPFLKEQMQTRKIIQENYTGFAMALYREGFKTEARAISQLANQLGQANTQTKAQAQFDTVKGNLTRSKDIDIER